VETNYKEGNLIRFVRHEDWDICTPHRDKGGYAGGVREYVVATIPLDFYDYFAPLESKVGLVVKVLRNRLDQPLGYEVQIGQDVMFFKYVLAQKYFKLVGEPEDGARKDSDV
tara:strand:+ start:16 stop:351 length:336 start_codon:yes stop_codon:yes gene_type:complete